MHSATDIDFYDASVTVVYDYSVVLGSYNLFATPTVSSGAVVHTHSLNTTDLSTAQVIQGGFVYQDGQTGDFSNIVYVEFDTPVETQFLTTNNIAVSATLSAGAVGVTHVVAAGALASTGSVQSGAMGQTHSLATTDTAATASIQAGAVTQGNAVSAGSLSSAATINAGNVSQTHTLSTTAITSTSNHTDGAVTASHVSSR